MVNILGAEVSKDFGAGQLGVPRTFPCEFTRKLDISDREIFDSYCSHSGEFCKDPADHWVNSLRMEAVLST